MSKRKTRRRTPRRQRGGGRKGETEKLCQRWPHCHCIVQGRASDCPKVWGYLERLLWSK